ncbi:MAG: ABC transporter permease [Herpetosiphonaceae bacterium]|nr:ABC transporter permease [Herpetosiphonaceae bacterium]
MRKVWFVARRDMLYHLRKRDFYWSTFGVPLIGIIIAVVARLLGGDPSGQNTLSTLNPSLPPGHTIGYVDDAGAITRHTTIVSPTLFQQFPDQPAGEAALRAEQISSLFILPADYQLTGFVTRTTRSAALFGGSDVNDFSTLLSANAMQTADTALAERLQRPFAIRRTVALSENVRVAGSLNYNVGGALVPILFAMAIYISIFMGASLLMQGVLEEKENRTLEVLMTSIAPGQLLVGKIIGLGIVALIQLLIWAAIGGAVLSQGGGLLSSLPEIALPWNIWVLLLVFFVLGYLFYASLMAGIGAISPSLRELSQLTIIISVPALIPIFFIPLLLNKPNGTVAIILSVIPFTAPSTMMMRQVMTVVPLWQTALSVGLMLLAVAATLKLASRLFRATTLLAGVKFSLRGLLRALR